MTQPQFLPLLVAAERQDREFANYRLVAGTAVIMSDFTSVAIEISRSREVKSNRQQDFRPLKAMAEWSLVQIFVAACGCCDGGNKANNHLQTRYRRHRRAE
jgi:hypothetical protein